MIGTSKIVKIANLVIFDFFRPSESENEDDVDGSELDHGNFGDDHQSLPRDDEDDLPANEEETNSLSSSHRVSSSSTTPTTATTIQVELEPTEKIS